MNFDYEAERHTRIQTFIHTTHTHAHTRTHDTFTYIHTLYTLYGLHLDLSNAGPIDIVSGKA